MLFVAGEEQGLLGSKYYSLHPTFAPGKIAANINYDGGNYRGRTHDLTQIGYGKSSLDGIANALVEKQGRCWCRTSSRTGLFLPLRPVHTSPRSACRRCTSTMATDYIGKPAGWGKHEQAKNGTEHVYHQPSDEIDRRPGCSTA